MYIATRWDPIYWNTACLIVNSGSLEEDSDFEEDEDGFVVQKKERSTDYAKIAKALGDIISRGIKVSLVDINKSDYSFEPDVDNHEILFGMKALSNISGPTIEQIKAGRPYAGIADFMAKCPLNKSAMISLIKAGAFDKLDNAAALDAGVETRIWVMAYYLSKVCDAKKKLTLQNFNGLLQHDLIPEELDFQKRTFNFNKYLKASQKVGKYYVFNEPCLEFYEKNFDVNQMEVINGCTCILQTRWDNIYKNVMAEARAWLQEHQEEMLKKFNTVLFKETWDKYAQGSISAWEMESLCFYYHEHELAHVNVHKYGIEDFFNLPAQPEVEQMFKRNGKEIPIFKTSKIIGTVINKNDNRNSITLLTTSGVVPVKFTKEYFAMYNRQLSEIQEDGTKHITEKGWFTRGVKVMETGFRRDDTFVAKTYTRTQTHQLYKIENIENGNMKLTHERGNQNEENN